MTSEDARCEGEDHRIELALADLQLLYRDGQTAIDGVTIDLLPGAKQLLESEDWP